jgi:photosystem II stability/assembly factor-like uncharacterized protein
LIAVGQNATLLHSEDGQSWTRRDVEARGWIYRVRYLNDWLVAVGQDGLVLTSRDGIDWSRRQPGTDRWLNDVLEAEGTFYVVGNQGTVLATADFESWTDLQVSTTKSLFGVSWDQGRLLVAGVEGIILRADIQPSTRQIRIADYARADGQNLFFIRGQAGQRFTLDASTNLQQWIPGPPFEFLDNSGTIIILSPKETNAPIREFYQAPLRE